MTLHITVTGQFPNIFQLPYIFYKVDLYIAATPHITVTLPFPKGDRCTQVWLFIHRRPFLFKLPSCCSLAITWSWPPRPKSSSVQFKSGYCTSLGRSPTYNSQIAYSSKVILQLVCFHSQPSLAANGRTIWRAIGNVACTGNRTMPRVVFGVNWNRMIGRRRWVMGCSVWTAVRVTARVTCWARAMSWAVWYTWNNSNLQTEWWEDCDL